MKDAKTPIKPVCPACGAVENGFLFYKAQDTFRDPPADEVECGDCHTLFDRQAPIDEGRRVVEARKG